MAEKDPITQVYDTIVSEFQKDHKNVVSYNTIRGPKKDVVTEADLPELTFVPDVAAIGAQGASCGDDISIMFQVMVKTGDQRLTPKLFPVMWKLLRAYRRLRFGALDSLIYNSRAFVTEVSIGTATMDLGAAERGVFGWACLWPITVMISLGKDDLS